MIKAGGDENFAVPNLLVSVGTSIGVDWDSILYIACTHTGQYTKEIEGS